MNINLIGWRAIFKDEYLPLYLTLLRPPFGSF